MSKTPFSNKCDILGALWLNYREDAKENEAWDNFFRFNDIGLPLAYILSEGIVVPAPIQNGLEISDAEDIIEETWHIFCEYIDIDPEEEYFDIADAWEASPQPPLDQDNE